jgi:hypothetical protein
MAKNYFAKSGIITTKATVGGFDIKRMVKDILKTLNVDFNDECCAATAVTQTMTAAGAVSLSTQITLLSLTAAGAITLADGVEGQEKTIKMKLDNGDVVLTPANLLGASTTITFNDANDFVILKFVDGQWSIVTNSGTTVA